MMSGKTRAIDKLQVSLREAIQTWMDNNCESPEWEALDGYVGEDIARMMSVAAIQVLSATIDVQDYIRDNGTTH